MPLCTAKVKDSRRFPHWRGGLIDMKPAETTVVEGSLCFSCSFLTLAGSLTLIPKERRKALE